MSKKKIRKRRGDPVGYCLGCGKRLRAHDRVCKRCGKRSPLFQSKSAGPMLIKSAGANVTPLYARRVCWNGHPVTKSAAKFCPDCGQPVGVSQAGQTAWAQKAVSPWGSPLGRQAQRENDPATRELLLTKAAEQAGSQARDPEVLAMSLGYRNLREAALTPGPYRDFFDRAYWGGNGGAA